MTMPLGGPSFGDGTLPDRLGRNENLERIHAAIDWERLVAVVADAAPVPSGSQEYAPVVMVKVLMLQLWYAASDEEMEEALDDRMSFRRFAGLGPTEPTPSRSAIGRFRDELSAQELAGPLLGELERQLRSRGVVVMQGVLDDVMLIEQEEG